MKKTEKILWCISAVSLLLFAVLLLCLLWVDVQPIGPESSLVGLATLNAAVHGALGIHSTWETITELIGFAAMGCAALLALLGAVQLIRRRSLTRVDADLYVLAASYIAVGALYVLFELWVINYRPIMVDGVREASFPSSHTLLVLCLLGTALYPLWHRVSNRTCRILGTVLVGLMMAVTACGRLLAGVHWFTDVLGAVLLSASVVCAYFALCIHLERK